MATTPTPFSYWSGHYPPPSRSFWSGHFPEGGAVSPVPGVVGFAIVLRDGATVTHAFNTHLFKARSGKEQRANNLDLPAETYKGDALIVGDDVRTMRGQLARYAAAGASFQLGLPHEETTIARTGSGATAAIASTLLLDWALAGIPVLIKMVASDGTQPTMPAVIASVTSTSITFDRSLGAFNIVGAHVMPTVQVYLDATSTFGRYTPAEPVETWSVSARAATFGWRSTTVPAKLALSSVTDAALVGLTISAIGDGGNGILITQSADALSTGGEVDEDAAARTLHFKYVDGVTTALDYVALFAGRVLVTIAGTYEPTDVLTSGDDDFTATPLGGGVDGALAEVGRGATLTTYAGRPVWDRRLANDATISDSIQAMTEVVDLGGIPLSASDTSIADWGRQVAMHGTSRAERQWLKKMLATTARGRWGSFWLPSWRADLIPLSIGAGSAGVKATLPLSVAASSGTVIAGLTLRAKLADASGNLIRASLTPDGVAPTGSHSEAAIDGGARFVYVKYVPSVTTVQNIVDLLGADSTLVDLIGTFTGSDLLTAPDEFVTVALYGGVDPTGSVITISQSAAAGDFTAWRGTRDRLQVQQADGTITYAQIVSVFTDGVALTYRLGIDATLSGSAVSQVSWLELVRFEKDDLAETFTGPAHFFSEQARVIQLRDDGDLATFDDYEQSYEHSQPREGISIVMAGETHLISTSDQDVMIGGVTYKAITAMRGVLAITSGGGTDSCVISLPVSHPAVRLYMRNGVPPMQAIPVTIVRSQPGGYRQEFSGLWTEMAVDGHIAKITVATRAGVALTRSLPTITVGRECSHVLYDSRCRVDRASFTYSTTVAGYSGAHIVLAGIPAYSLKYGELLHISSGARVTIGTQVGTALDVQVAIPEMRDGDAVQVFAGCAHVVAIGVGSLVTGNTCLATFNNVVNYGGLPELPTLNPFKPSGGGLVGAGVIPP